MVSPIYGRLGKWVCSSSQILSKSYPLASSTHCIRIISNPSLSKFISYQKLRSFSSSSIQNNSATFDVNSHDENSGAEDGAPPLVAFESLKGSVSYETLKAITVKPFHLKDMTPVQGFVLPLLPGLADPYTDPSSEEEQSKERVDLLVRAKTGTGKTIAFLVPAIEARLKAIKAHAKKAVADQGLVSDKHLEERAARRYARQNAGCLIISPTRELAIQIAAEAVKLTTHHSGFEVRLFTGGNSKRTQMRDWMKGRRDIVVTTPGRMRDLLTSEPDVVEGLKNTPMLILDEADTLLDMGFRDDIDAIVEYLPKVPERQTFLFSATVSTGIRQIARKTLHANHVFINTVSEDASPVHSHIPQYHTVLPSAKDQLLHILRLLAHDQLTNPQNSKTIVFLPTTKMTQLYATFLRQLSKNVLPAGRNTQIYEIHSKRTQEARTSTSNAFRNDRSGAAILVTSDVSARGIDYPGTTRVIQVGIPSSSEQYIHRVGRTGRAQTSGRGDLVLLPWEIGFVTWQLTEVPMKSVTTNELKKQVHDLAAKYDNDAKSSAPAEERRTSGSQLKDVAVFRPPVSDRLNTMESDILNLFSAIDEEAVRETFASLLGYYIPKSGELRVQRNVIVQGCKDWTVESCGLPTPPYVSEQFLARLGFHDGRTSRFGYGVSDAPKRFTKDPSKPSWMNRGRVGQKMNSRPSRERELLDREIDPDDPVRQPEEYRTNLYGKESRSRPTFRSFPERRQSSDRGSDNYRRSNEDDGSRRRDRRDGYGIRNSS